MATEHELGPDNIRDTHWLGEVVDNKDPLHNGRCRVKVFGKFDTLPVDTIPWASPANIMAPGQYLIPRLGDIVSIVFDNGNIYLPTYSYQVNQNPELKKDLLDGSAAPENVISLIYDALRNFRFYSSKEDGLIMTTGSDKHAAPMLRFSPDGKIFINSENIFIASGWQDESEPAVKGETLRKTLNQFMDAFINHTHLTPAGVPTSTPIPPASIQVTTEKSKLESIKQVKAAAATSNPSSSTTPGNTTSNSNNSTTTTASNASGGESTKPESVKSDSAAIIPTQDKTSTTKTTVINGTTMTYSAEDELLTFENPEQGPVTYAGVTATVVEQIDSFDKDEGGSDPVTFYNGNASDKQKNSVIRAVEATHSKGDSKGRCARYTYNTAKNYVAALNNKKLTQGAGISAGGNANGQGYFKSLQNLGYKYVNGGNNMSKAELAKILTQDFDIGDVVTYWSTDGPASDSNRKYGHTQMFTGGLHSKSNGYKWTTDSLNNYRKAFVYKARPANNWNLIIFKAPQA
jgi:hypothetical protein